MFYSQKARIFAVPLCSNWPAPVGGPVKFDTVNWESVWVHMGSNGFLVLLPPWRWHLSVWRCDNPLRGNVVSSGILNAGVTGLVSTALSFITAHLSPTFCGIELLHIFN